jgi:hypothetical protein
MTKSRSVGRAGGSRRYRLSTALDGPVEDAGRTSEIALRGLRQEHAAVSMVQN